MAPEAMGIEYKKMDFAEQEMTMATAGGGKQEIGCGLLSKVPVLDL